jgi:hypothetical protein
VVTPGHRLPRGTHVGLEESGGHLIVEQRDVAPLRCEKGWLHALVRQRDLETGDAPCSGWACKRYLVRLTRPRRKLRRPVHAQRTCDPQTVLLGQRG